jgi:hypothetical protein
MNKGFSYGLAALGRKEIIRDETIRDDSLRDETIGDVILELGFNEIILLIFYRSYFTAA